MGAKWVKALKPITRFALDGSYRTYQPGDWFEANNQEIRTLLQGRRIEVANKAIKAELLADSCAIVVTGGDVARARQYVAAYTGMVYDGLPHFPPGAQHCLWWNAAIPLRLDLLPLGFHRVTAGWQIAAPLWRYNVLARDIGTDAARQRTEEVIHDLRVPVFETGLLYVRRDTDMERLLELWLQERATGDDDKLCFLRALYAVKPILCALPQTWVSNAR